MLNKPLLNDDTGGASKYPISSSLSAKFSEEEMFTMKDQFSRFDSNGDGSIDAQELAVIMELIGEKCSPDQLKSLMADADTDGDGTVSFVEFVELVFRTKEVKFTAFVPCRIQIP